MLWSVGDGNLLLVVPPALKEILVLDERENLGSRTRGERTSLSVGEPVGISYSTHSSKVA